MYRSETSHIDLISEKQFNQSISFKWLTILTRYTLIFFSFSHNFRMLAAVSSIGQCFSGMVVIFIIDLNLYQVRRGLKTNKELSTEQIEQWTTSGGEGSW